MIKRKKERMSLEAARIRLASLCARSEQCESDLKLKMKKWGFTREETQSEIDYLYDNNFLNEERYANAYCHDKLKFYGWGRNKIRAALSLKKISSDVITAALDNIDEEEYKTAIFCFINEKKRQFDISDYKDRQKLLRSAYLRGFEPSLVSSEISKMLNKS